MKVALVILIALALAGCGGHTSATPTQVARSWSAALDRNDNEAAGLLFADGAEIVQDGALTLRTHADAVRWNASLPCGGRIITLELRSKTQVLVVFVLTERPHHACDAPGGKAAAVFQVRNGKIVLWHQTDVPPQLAPGTYA